MVLFERTGRGLLPTDMALRLADAARAMEAGAHQLARSVSGAEGGVGLWCASPPTSRWPAYLLPPLRWRRCGWPRRTSGWTWWPANAVKATNLLRREADIAVRMVQPDQATLAAKRVGKVTLSACAHHDYLRRRGTPATHRPVEP